MGNLYTRPTHDVFDLIAEVRDRWHPELDQHEVTVGALMVEDEANPIFPVLRHQGYPAVAVVKLTPLEKRALGQPDAVIVFDRARWERMTDEERRAVVDHELEHLEPVLGEGGELKRDSAGRPKLRLRRHDMVIGGFEAIVRRHGRHAVEASAFKMIHESMRQMEFGWSDDQASPTEAVKEAWKETVAEVAQVAKKARRKAAAAQAQEGL